MAVHNFIDLNGQRFGKLVVEHRAANDNRGTARWNCVCDCGAKIIVAARHLRSGKTRSCKCLWANRTKHGATTHTTKSIEYRAWLGAKMRCFNRRTNGYENWGGRGITMCDKWKNDFEAFLRDMGPCPNGYSLDRYPNQSGNYEPGNCRWASRIQQNRNTRRARLLNYNGAVKPMSQWCEELGLKHSTLWARLFVWHWPIELALTTPIKK